MHLRTLIYNQTDNKILKLAVTTNGEYDILIEMSHSTKIRREI
jgi:hypothetical protein